MATMYAPGARRSAAPSYSPRSALTSQALYDDQVTKDLLDAMLSAVQPAGIGQSQAGVNLGEVLGSGTSIVDSSFGAGGTGDGAGDSGGTAPAGGPGGLGVVGDIGQAFSALGFLGQDSTMAQLGQTLGQAATIGTAVGQAAQGNLGQAAMSLAPMAANALGMPASLAGVAATAANPTLGQVDTQAAIVNAALSALAPPVAAVTSLAQMMGLVPTTKSMLTPVENIDVNAMIADQEAMQAAMEEGVAIAAGFDAPVTDSFMGFDAEAAFGDVGGFGMGDAGAAAAVGADGTDAGAGGTGVGGDTAGATGADGTDGGAGGAGMGDGTAAAASGDSSGDAGGGGGGGGGACFLTTAAVEHMGQKDDGEVLSTLRRFRDSYMRKDAEKLRDVAWYYEHAPRIVDALSRSPDVAKLYQEMYDSYIYPSYEAIKANNMERAYELYRAGVIFAQKASGVNTSDRAIPSTSA